MGIRPTALIFITGLMMKDHKILLNFMVLSKILSLPSYCPQLKALAELSTLSLQII